LGEFITTVSKGLGKGGFCEQSLEFGLSENNFQYGGDKITCGLRVVKLRVFYLNGR
jgi:hypothetical protein